MHLFSDLCTLALARWQPPPNVVAFDTRAHTQPGWISARRLANCRGAYHPLWYKNKAGLLPNCKTLRSESWQAKWKGEGEGKEEKRRQVGERGRWREGEEKRKWRASFINKVVTSIVWNYRRLSQPREAFGEHCGVWAASMKLTGRIPRIPGSEALLPRLAALQPQAQRWRSLESTSCPTGCWASA